MSNKKSQKIIIIKITLFNRINSLKQQKHKIINIYIYLFFTISFFDLFLLPIFLFLYFFKSYSIIFYIFNQKE